VVEMPTISVKRHRNFVDILMYLKYPSGLRTEDMAYTIQNLSTHLVTVQNYAM